MQSVKVLCMACFYDAKHAPPGAAAIIEMVGLCYLCMPIELGRAFSLMDNIVADNQAIDGIDWGEIDDACIAILALGRE